MNQPWQVDEPTTDELRERVAVVLRQTHPFMAGQVLTNAGIASDVTMLELGCGCVPHDLSHVELERWLAALTKPLETTG